jgi:acyl-CoA synthetase (AMP-forming)/AMP-acid ligase II
MILGDVIEHNERCSGGHPAVLFEGCTLTHREFAQRVKRLINALATRGFDRQTRMAVLSRNCPQYLEVYGAAGLGGFVAMGLNYRLSAVEQAAILKDAEPMVFFFESEYRERTRELRDSLAGDTLFICFDAPSDRRGEFIAYEGLLQDVQPEPLARRAGPEDTLFLIYTSGTTGRPKGVMLGNAGQLDQARVQSISHAATPTDRMLIVMPFYHIGGPTELLTYLMVGATIVLHRQFDATEILHSIAEHRVTAAHLAPTMIGMMLDVQEKSPFDLSSLHTVCYASAPMSVALSIRARRLFGPIFMQIYGMTEAGLGSTLLKHQHVLDGDERQRGRLASAGQPYLGTELKILAEDGSPCPPGVVGEICMRSNSTMQGYWRNPQATAETLKDGLLHTGDMGYLDEDHYLFIVDRKKDMVISGGENIYSREVEEALLMHPDVAEAAVIGVPDAKWGESVAAMVVLKAGAVADGTALDAHCRSLIAGYKRPKLYRFLDAMPRVASTNKIDKRALRAPYWDGQQRQVS